MTSLLTRLRLVLPLLLCTITALCFTSCDDYDAMAISYEVPETYTFTREGNSTVSFEGQKTRIAMAEELVAGMSDPSNSLQNLNDLFRNPDDADPFSDPVLNGSTKSVRSKVAASEDLFATNNTLSAEIRGTFDAYLERQATEVFPAWNQLAAQGQAGQVADGNRVRYVNANGLEYNQAFAKSLIGGLMYDQLANNYLSPAVLDAGNNRTDNDAGITEAGKAYTAMEHKWDEAFGYLFGASANQSTPLSDLGGGDNFLNEYLSRVNDNAFYAGTAEKIEAAFREGRAAIVAGDYEARDAQADIIKNELKKVMPVRAIFYLVRGMNQLDAEPGNENFGSGFHALSEAYGFIYSLRFIDGSVTESDAFLAELANEANGGFWTISTERLNELSMRVASAYGLNADEASL